MKKHEIEFKEFICPFCENKKVIKTQERFVSDDDRLGTYGVDYWECQNCGEENDIGLECFEKYFKIFKKYTEKNDWEGLHQFCVNNEFDDFMLYSLAKYYIQKQEFQKSLRIAKILVELDPRDICSEELIEKSNKGLQLLKK